MSKFTSGLLVALVLYTSCVLISSAAAMDLSSSRKKNLTSVTWAHAVNSRELLEKCLNSSVMMLEADIVLGKLINGSSNEDIPIMGHPPATTSDLSLEEFLTNVLQFNNNNNENKKGVKLDFKTIEVFERSLPILQAIYPKMDYPLWINADIIAGPENATRVPVNPVRFLGGAKQFTASILSIGWTTRLIPGFKNITYSDSQVQEMLDCINNNDVTQPITFPVHSGIAANSLEGMKKLVDEVQNSTLTLWSHSGDEVDVDALRTLIFTVGLDKVYADLPEDLKDKLHLDVPPS